MNRSLKSVVPLIALAICLLVVSGAGAKVIPSVSTTLSDELMIPPDSPTGYTTYVDQPNNVLGAHADYTVDMHFKYGATGTLYDDTFAYEDPATYPQPSDFRESVKDIVVDSPAGLVGNPNAVPYAERCDISTFETSVCPDSAVVGRYTITTTLLAKGADEGGPTSAPVPGKNYINIDVLPVEPDYTPEDWEGFTKLALLKTDPEVPAKIGIYVKPPFGFHAIRQTLEISPDTDGQLQLRTRAFGIDRQLLAGPASASPEGTLLGNFRISFQQIRFYGRLANGNAFMTNPTSCEKWKTTIWSRAHFVNDNLDADPLRTGINGFKQGNTSEITPDCTNQGSVPFPITGNVAIDAPKRDYSPAFDFTIDNPGVQANGAVSTSPKKIVTTIPASLNVDVQQLGRTCPIASFNADTCAASTRVGSVKIETPLLRPGLTGDVYLVKRVAGSGLPDLGLRLRGAITFTQLGSNRYVGARFNQIETTFDNIPQIGFSKLTFHLDGGPNGLLRSLSCPTYNKAPAVPNFTYNFTAWTGATATSTTPLNMANCFGIQQLKKYPKCLHSILPIHPNYQSRSRLKRVVLKVDKKRKATRKSSPFRFDLPIGQLKPGRHSFELKATYDDGTVSKKTATFKKC
ncbi:MAG: hypothetical protein JHC98_07775 [Thermoleophilaceae bacterium]|nr:hypothetical protein [Thermoleophilaceae bacterium]